jgi:hypothetical protein
MLRRYINKIDLDVFLIVFTIFIPTHVDGMVGNGEFEAVISTEGGVVCWGVGFTQGS